MTRKARDKIAAGLREAIAVARRDEKPARLHVKDKPDWQSFFAREIDPEVAGWEFKREKFEDRDVFKSAQTAKSLLRVLRAAPRPKRKESPV